VRSERSDLRGKCELPPLVHAAIYRAVKVIMSVSRHASAWRVPSGAPANGEPATDLAHATHYFLTGAQTGSTG